MPNLDGTGPQGQGAKTGRGMGNCTENNQNFGCRRGCGRRPACGRGMRRAGIDTPQNPNNNPQK